MQQGTRCGELCHTWIPVVSITDLHLFHEIQHNTAHCPSFNIQRRDLLAGMSVVLQPFVQINTLSNNVLVQLLLYGDKNLSSDVNKHVLKLTLNFIHQSGRFD